MIPGSFPREFAKEAACVFAGNGITACIFEQLTSVPELSFAVRHLKADGGIVITASHNPRQYNGYKVYAAYGGQLGPEESLDVMACIQKLDPFKDVKRIGYGEGVAKGLILEIGEEIDRLYYERMVTLCGAESAEDLKVVYTPLHGTGLRTVEHVFPAAGIKNLFIVEEQRMPDGLFPTVNSPNPEDPGAMKMAIALAGTPGGRSCDWHGPGCRPHGCGRTQTRWHIRNADRQSDRMSIDQLYA